MKSRMLFYWRFWRSLMRSALWPRGGWLKFFRRLPVYLLRLRSRPHSVALGFAAGVFVSFSPFLGFHFLAAALLAWIAGGNIIAAFIGTAVGNPLTFPFIWYAAYNLGGMMLGRAALSGASPEMSEVFWLAVLGGVPLGLAAAVIAYVPVYFFLLNFNRRRAARRVAAAMVKHHAK